MRIICYLFFTSLVLSMNFDFAIAASFDCDKATTATEIAICDDSEISALDELMLVAYKQALRSNDWKYDAEERNDSSLIETQRTALKSQASCGANSGCLKNFYNKRIIELLNLGGLNYEGFKGDPIEGLLKFGSSLNSTTDLRAIASSADGSVNVLLISAGDPKNINRANTGTVYNTNPHTFLFSYSANNQNIKDQILDGPSVTSLELSLYVAPSRHFDNQPSFHLIDHHTRGSSITKYELDYESWVLASVEDRQVTRPGSGLFQFFKTDYLAGIEYAFYSYIFLSCEITAQPVLIGDTAYGWEIDGFDRDFVGSQNPDENEALLGFMTNLTDRDLHIFSTYAFTEYDFEVSKLGFEMLSSRGYAQSEKNLSCVNDAIKNK
jgi:uncharacterized protein